MLLKFAAFQTLGAVLVPQDASPQHLRALAHRHEFKYEPRPGYLYVRSRAISSRTNDNYDEFPAAEIEKSYKTFIGKPVFVNHVNDNHKRARGVVIDAALHKDRLADGHPDVWAEVLMEVDARNFPKLAKAILEKRVDRTSMGCDVEYSICSMCGNKATTPAEYCQHIPRLKGKKVLKRNSATGAQEEHLIRETCYGLKFFENSLLVEEPADPTAFFTGVDDSGIKMAASKQAAYIDERGFTRDICSGCLAPIRSTSDPNLPWVHDHSSNAKCDVGSPADAVMLQGVDTQVADPMTAEASRGPDDPPDNEDTSREDEPEGGVIRPENLTLDDLVLWTGNAGRPIGEDPAEAGTVKCDECGQGFWTDADRHSHVIEEHLGKQASSAQRGPDDPPDHVDHDVEFHKAMTDFFNLIAKDNPGLQKHLDDPETMNRLVNHMSEVIPRHAPGTFDRHVDDQMRGKEAAWDGPCGCGEGGHLHSEHAEWAKANNRDAWGRPIKQPYDGHGAWDCNNYDCAEHPQEMYEQRPGQAPGWMQHEHDPHKEITREVGKHFHEQGLTEDARWLLDQQDQGPTKYSLLQHFAAQGEDDSYGTPEQRECAKQGHGEWNAHGQCKSCGYTMPDEGDEECDDSYCQENGFPEGWHTKAEHIDPPHLDPGHPDYESAERNIRESFPDLGGWIFPADGEGPSKYSLLQHFAQGEPDPYADPRWSDNHGPVNHDYKPWLGEFGDGSSRCLYCGWHPDEHKQRRDDPERMAMPVPEKDPHADERFWNMLDRLHMQKEVNESVDEHADWLLRQQKQGPTKYSSLTDMFRQAHTVGEPPHPEPVPYAYEGKPHPVTRSLDEHWKHLSNDHGLSDTEIARALVGHGVGPSPPDQMQLGRPLTQEERQRREEWTKGFQRSVMDAHKGLHGGDHTNQAGLFAHRHKPDDPLFTREHHDPDLSNPLRWFFYDSPAKQHWQRKGDDLQTGPITPVRHSLSSLTAMFAQAGVGEHGEYSVDPQTENNWLRDRMVRDHLLQHHGFTHQSLESLIDHHQKEQGAEPGKEDTLMGRAQGLMSVFERLNLTKKLHVQEHGGDLTQDHGLGHDHAHPDDPLRVETRDPGWYRETEDVGMYRSDKSPVQYGGVAPTSEPPPRQSQPSHHPSWQHQERSHVRDWLHPERTDERPNKMAEPYYHHETEQWIDPKDNLRLDDEDVARLEKCPHTYPDEHEARTYPEEGERSQCKSCGQEIALHATTKPSQVGEPTRRFYEDRGKRVLDKGTGPFWPLKPSLSSLFHRFAQWRPGQDECGECGSAMHATHEHDLFAEKDCDYCGSEEHDTEDHEDEPEEWDGHVSYEPDGIHVSSHGRHLGTARNLDHATHMLAHEEHRQGESVNWWLHGEHGPTTRPLHEAHDTQAHVNTWFPNIGGHGSPHEGADIPDHGPIDEYSSADQISQHLIEHHGVHPRELHTHHWLKPGDEGHSGTPSLKDLIEQGVGQGVPREDIQSTNWERKRVPLDRDGLEDEHYSQHEHDTCREEEDCTYPLGHTHGERDTSHLFDPSHFGDEGKRDWAEFLISEHQQGPTKYSSAGGPPDHPRLTGWLGPNRNEGWVRCDQGHEHWGVEGAAGLLLRHTDKKGVTRYLLQHRAPWVDHGNTYSIPGGALNEGEEPHEAAFREAHEELGGLPKDIKHHKTLSSDHGGWAYHTVIADAPHRFRPRGGDDGETGSRGSNWFTSEEIEHLPLHPGFKQTWNKVSTASLSLTSMFRMAADDDETIHSTPDDPCESCGSTNKHFHVTLPPETVEFFRHMHEQGQRHQEMYEHAEKRVVNTTDPIDLQQHMLETHEYEHDDLWRNSHDEDHPALGPMRNEDRKLTPFEMLKLHDWEHGHGIKNEHPDYGGGTPGHFMGNSHFHSASRKQAVSADLCHWCYEPISQGEKNGFWTYLHDATGEHRGEGGHRAAPLEDTGDSPDYSQKDPFRPWARKQASWVGDYPSEPTLFWRAPKSGHEVHIKNFQSSGEQKVVYYDPHRNFHFPKVTHDNETGHPIAYGFYQGCPHVPPHVHKQIAKAQAEVDKHAENHRNLTQQMELLDNAKERQRSRDIAQSMMDDIDRAARGEDVPGTYVVGRDKPCDHCAGEGALSSGEQCPTCRGRGRREAKKRASKWKDWEAPHTRCAICKQDATRLDDGGLEHEDLELDEHHDFIPEAGEPDPSHIVSYYDKDGNRQIVLPPHEAKKKDDGPKCSGVVLKAADTGRVLMIQRSNKDEKDPAAGTWEFPGGHHEEDDQTSLHAGIREWEEEVGQPFPTGGNVAHTWRSPNGVYQGHVVVVPSEEDAVDFSDGRATVNPDDPDGDDHEQACWWDPKHAEKNPALRPECKKTPWDEIRKAKYGKEAAAEFEHHLDPRREHDRCNWCGKEDDDLRRYETRDGDVESFCGQCEGDAFQPYRDTPLHRPHNPDLLNPDPKGHEHPDFFKHRRQELQPDRARLEHQSSVGGLRHDAAVDQPEGVPGTVYLLHFDQPFGHARHYMGWARDLEARLWHHENGTGANLLKHVKNAGIGWSVARTWEGDRNLERRLKIQGGHARKCPTCKGGTIRDTVHESELPPTQAASDYRGHHEAPDADDGSSMHDPSGIMPDVHEHPEYYCSPHYTGSYESHSALMSVRGKPEKSVFVYRAVPHGVKHINPGDWVTPSHEYARQHAQESCPGCGKNMQILKARVKAKHLHGAGDITEWGYTGEEPVQTWGSYRMSCPSKKQDAVRRSA